MGWFDFFTKKKEVSNINVEHERKIQAMIDESNKETASFDVYDINTIDKDDYNGLYANASHQIQTALKAKDYDKAWSLTHSMQEHALNSAKRQNMTKKQTFNFLSSIDIIQANILRLEKRHLDALAHIIKAYIQSEVPKSKSGNRLPAYWKRAKLHIDDIDKGYAYIKRIQKSTGFEITEPIRAEIYRWLGKM